MRSYKRRYIKALTAELTEEDQTMRILARAKAGDFGFDGHGSPPGVWPLNGRRVKIGDTTFGICDALLIAVGELTPPTVGVVFGVRDVQRMPPKQARNPRQRDIIKRRA